VDRDSASALVGQSILYTGEVSSGPQRATASPATGKLRIAAVRLLDDSHTVVFATDPHARAGRYVLPLPGSKRNSATTNKRKPPLTFEYELSGVEVAWCREGEEDAQPRWSGWWPKLDVAAAQRLARGSRPHADLFNLLRMPGRLALSSLVRLPKGPIILNLESSKPIHEASLGDAQGEPDRAADAGNYHLSISCSSEGEPLFLTVTVATGKVIGEHDHGNGRPLSLRAVFRAKGEKVDHELEPPQLILPWAALAPSANASATAPVILPDLAGGDPAAGRALFLDDRARCSQCHTFRGQGGQAGPDLSDIGRKSRAEIYRSIAAPSAAIDPDYTTYTIVTMSGQVVAGLARAEGADMIRVVDQSAHAIRVPRDQIQQIRPSATSIMPVGLTATLGDTAIRDIIAYLTCPDARPAAR
jgi:putative heme-binding domain-containing protein